MKLISKIFRYSLIQFRFSIFGLVTAVNWIRSVFSPGHAARRNFDRVTQSSSTLTKQSITDSKRLYDQEVERMTLERLERVVRGPSREGHVSRSLTRQLD